MLIFYTLILLSVLASNVYGVILDSALLTHLGYNNERWIIYISNSNIDDIDPNAFKGYFKMKSLTLTNNSLTKVDLEVFKDMVNLDQLYMQDNPLTQLTNSKKILFPSLRVLELSGCPLTSFDTNVANALPFLDYLSVILPSPIKPNQLTTLPWKHLETMLIRTKNQTSLTKDHLNGLNSVFSFSFTNSNIKTIEVHSLLALANAYFIDLHNNELTSFEYLQIPTKVYELDLSGNKMNYFMLSRTMGVLQRLNINNNLFRSFKSMDFTFLANLTFLSLSNNPHAYPNEIAGHLKPLVNLMTIEISNLSINSTDSNFFKQNTKLTSISMSNNKISVLPFNIFSHLKDLKYLDLSSNQISFLDNRTFAGLSEFYYLNLENNKLSKLWPKTFENLLISSLKLSLNQITELDNSSFDGVKSISDLDLSNNYISRIGPGTFNSSNITNSLTLFGNRLTKIENGSFAGLNQLAYIDLRYNKMETIEAGAFNGLTKVERFLLNNNNFIELHNSFFFGVKSIRILDLSENKISTLETGTFKVLIQSLILDFNQLTKIKSGAFVDQYLLYYISFSNNYISTIESGAFDGLINLQNIHLESNNLTQLDNSTFAGRNNLEGIFLANNPNLITNNLQSVCPTAAVNCKVYF